MVTDRKRGFVGRSLCLWVLITLAVSGWAGAQSLESFEKKTTLHVLENGWTFIIVERPVAPVFSFMTRVNVGSAQEVTGITGLAHMFEHMAFKGTPTIGTTDYEAEKQALQELEAAYMAYQYERLSPHPNPKLLARLKERFEEKQAQASQYVVKNEFGDIIDREGGVHLNAYTSADATGYFYSLPSNKVELFAYLESERFLHPVFREFYKERDVVQEERRMRVESRPTGRLMEQFLTTAFTAHTYHHPVIGYMSDIESYSMTDARRFFEMFYVPSNMVTAIVGDVKAQQVIPLLETYFGRIPAGPEPPRLHTEEPPQIAEKTVVLEEQAQPFYVEGYHKPSGTHPDQPVYDAIDDILANGRTSRLYRSLVRDKKLAVAVQSFLSYPGEKYPHLWAVLAVPARGIANDAVRAAIREELDRMKDKPVTDEELDKFKTRAKAGLIRSLDNNLGLAMNLTYYQMLFGDWRELFRYIDRLDQVTKADVQRVAKDLFRKTNRTEAMIVTVSDGNPSASVPGAPSP